MKILGNIERFDTRQISGWIYLKGDDSERPVLQALYDGRVVAEGRADRAREDLRKAGHGDGACEFRIDIPRELQPERTRLRLRIKDTEIYLTRPDGIDAKNGHDDTVDTAGNARKVFISGAARSGTSVVLLALADTLKAPVAGEGHILPLYQSILYKYFSYAQGFKDQPGVLASHLDFKSFQGKMHSEVRSLYNRLFPAGSFIDKTPGHVAIDSLRIARAVFPECRIIIMRRSGLEVVNSFVAKFAAQFNLACVEWRDSMRATKQLLQIFPDLFLLEHSLLRSDPGEAAARITRYLGVPDKSEALHRYFKSHEIDRLSPNEHETPPRLLDMGWPDKHVQEFRQICGAEMLENGYAF